MIRANARRTLEIIMTWLDSGAPRSVAVRAAIDAGCHWDTIHRVLCDLERRGVCERRRVYPARIFTSGGDHASAPGDAC